MAVPSDSNAPPFARRRRAGERRCGRVAGHGHYRSGSAAAADPNHGPRHRRGGGGVRRSVRDADLEHYAQRPEGWGDDSRGRSRRGATAADLRGRRTRGAGRVYGFRRYRRDCGAGRECDADAGAGCGSGGEGMTNVKYWDPLKRSEGEKRLEGFLRLCDVVIWLGLGSTVTGGYAWPNAKILGLGVSLITVSATVKLAGVVVAFLVMSSRKTNDEIE